MMKDQIHTNGVCSNLSLKLYHPRPTHALGNCGLLAIHPVDIAPQLSSIRPMDRTDKKHSSLLEIFIQYGAAENPTSKQQSTPCSNLSHRKTRKRGDQDRRTKSNDLKEIDQIRLFEYVRNSSFISDRYLSAWNW